MTILTHNHASKKTYLVGRCESETEFVSSVCGLGSSSRSESTTGDGSHTGEHTEGVHSQVETVESYP